MFGRHEFRSRVCCRSGSRRRFAADSGNVRGIRDCDRFRVFMLGVVFFCMNLLMLLQVLGPLEGFVTDLSIAN